MKYLVGASYGWTVVRQFKHLGCNLAAHASWIPDVDRRTTQSSAVLCAITRNILASRELDASSKLNCVFACVLSRLAKSTHTGNMISRRQPLVLEAVHMRVVQRATATTFDKDCVNT